MEPVIKAILIPFSEGGGSETVYGEQIGADTYKLLENPIFSCRINYGTFVRVVTAENGDLTLVKVVRASEYKTRQFMLSSSLNHGELREKIGEPICQAGGSWEVVMGGMAFVHIPRDSNFDLDKLFRDNRYFPTEIIDNETK